MLHFEPRDVTKRLVHIQQPTLSCPLDVFRISTGFIMAANKALLKEIGQDIQKSKFGDAISKAKEVLERDAKNYQASVTL
jgi:hypothetical protein